MFDDEAVKLHILEYVHRVGAREIFSSPADPSPELDGLNPLILQRCVEELFEDDYIQFIHESRTFIGPESHLITVYASEGLTDAGRGLLFRLRGAISE